MSPPSGSSVYKKYQCRYFDLTGRPVNTGCSQGDNCRFVHPEDKNWPGLRYIDKRPHVKPNRGPSPSRSYYDRTRGRTVSRSPSLERGRRRALVSQTDLFHRSTVEPSNKDRDDHCSHTRERSRRSEISSSKPEVSHQSRHHGSSTSPERIQRSFGEFKSPTRLAARQKFSDGRNDSNTSHDQPRKKDEKQVDILQTSPRCRAEDDPFSSRAALESKRDPARIPLMPRYETSTVIAKDGQRGHRTEKIACLFRDLAKHYGQSVQNYAAHERAETKLNSYSEISKVLSRVSKPAADALAPALTNVLVNHSESKLRVESDSKAIGDLWKQIFGVFEEEANNILAAKLRVLADAVGSPQRSQTVAGDKRSFEQIVESPEENDRRKRAKISGTHFGTTSSTEQVKESPSTENHFTASGATIPGAQLVAKPPGTRLTVKEELLEMQKKMDEQAERLKLLMNENDKLKASLSTKGSDTASEAIHNHLKCSSITEGGADSHVLNH